MKSSHFILSGLAGIVALACSSGAPDSGAAPLAGGADAAVDAAPARSEACVAMDAELQGAVERSKGSAPNAILAVKNEACGTSVYVAGDTATATPASVFRAGSITKTFVAATIVSLVAEGALSLDDLASKWLPGQKGIEGVTIRMLLNHTSGIPDYINEDATLARDPAVPRTPQELLDLGTSHPSNFAPGSAFRYSNTNYTVLGMITELIVKTKLGAALHARAIDRAGLRATFFDGDETPSGDLVKGFDTAKKDVSFKWSPKNLWASGAMVASASDVAEWVYALHGTDKVLDASSRALLVSPPLYQAPDGVTQYGLGTVILAPAATGGGGQGLGHGGDIDGYHSMALYFPAKKTSLVAFVNKDGQQPVTVLRAAFPIVFR